MVEVANRSRGDVSFNVGDLVWVNTTHVVPDADRQRPSKKLCPKFVGPFPVLATHGSAYTLDFPPTIRVHKTVNVSALKRFRAPSALDQDSLNTPPDAVDVKGDTHFEIETILRHRKRGRGFQFLVKWLGYPDHDSSWLPARRLVDSASDLLRDYKSKHGL